MQKRCWLVPEGLVGHCLHCKQSFRQVGVLGLALPQLMQRSRRLLEHVRCGNTWLLYRSGEFIPFQVTKLATVESQRRILSSIYDLQVVRCARTWPRQVVCQRPYRFLDAMVFSCMHVRLEMSPNNWIIVVATPLKRPIGWMSAEASEHEELANCQE